MMILFFPSNLKHGNAWNSCISVCWVELSRVATKGEVEGGGGTYQSQKSLLLFYMQMQNAPEIGMDEQQNRVIFKVEQTPL